MDGEKINFDNQNRLKSLKTLFSKFVAVANNIDALHNSINLGNRNNVKQGEKLREVDFGSSLCTNVLIDSTNFPNGPTDSDSTRDSNLASSIIGKRGSDCEAGAIASAQTNEFPNTVNVLSAPSEIECKVGAIGGAQTNEFEWITSAQSTDLNNGTVVKSGEKVYVVDFGYSPCTNVLLDSTNSPNGPTDSDSTRDSNLASSIIGKRGSDCEAGAIASAQTNEFLNTVSLRGFDYKAGAIASAKTNEFPNTVKVLSPPPELECEAGANSSAQTNEVPNTDDGMSEFECEANVELDGIDGACSNVLIDVEMNSFQQNMEHASETVIESIDTYPVLMEVTDFVNRDNLQKFTIGTKTYYTNGELTYEPLMDWDSESLDFSSQIFEQSNINLPTSQLHNKRDEDQNIQSHNRSRPIYENFMFGYEDDVDVSIDRNIGHQNIVTMRQSLPPTDLFMNVKSSDRSCDDRDMVVCPSDQPKRLFCVYCKKCYPKLARHLTTVHKNEVAVKAAKHLPKGSKERRTVLDGIRKKGTFLHNSNPKYHKGVMITSRRSRIPRMAKLQKTCAICKDSYSKKSIRTHFKKCSKNALNGERAVLVLARIVEGRIHELACDTLRLDIFPYMTEDDIVRLIRFDWLVVVYGNKLCDRHVEVFQNNVISQKLRRAGRLFYELKYIQPEITDLASVFQPKYYDSVIKAIRVLGKFNPVTKYYGSPSTALAMVTEIRAIGQTLIAQYIKKENFESQIRTENFIKLYNTEVVTDINKAVYRTQNKMKRDKREILPTTEDVRLLARFVDRERKAYFESVSKQFSYNAWLKLAEYTMASLIIFNRRRTGETQNILVTDFERRERLNHQMIDTLPVEDQKLARKYCRMKIRGKLDRTVPALIKPDVEKCMKLLIDSREDARIPIQNEFLFAQTTFAGMRIKRIDGCALLRKLSVLCGAKQPETLRGTKMRKHIATMCVSMELSENAVGEVAEFMGHEDKIHRKHYRQMPIVREIVKMSRILESAQGAYDDEDDDDDDDDDDELGNNENQTNQVQSGIFENASNGKAQTNVNGNDEHLDEGDGHIEENIDGEANGLGHVEVNIDGEANGLGHVEVNIDGEGEGGESKKYPKKRWNAEEKSAAHEAFAVYFKNRKLPSKKVILEEKRRHNGLKNRSHEMIKAWISNQFKKG